MEPTSSPGLDPAISAVDTLSPSKAAQAEGAGAVAAPLPDNWLSRAMALWLQDTDGIAGGVAPLAPH
jgi:hypothetical protein